MIRDKDKNFKAIYNFTTKLLPTSEDFSLTNKYIPLSHNINSGEKKPMARNKINRILIGLRLSFSNKYIDVYMYIEINNGNK
jgi:hypothetical protein